MKRILSFCFSCLLCLAGSASAAAPQKPNILLFYADDLGYGELGCYGFSTCRSTPSMRPTKRRTSI